MPLCWGGGGLAWYRREVLHLWSDLCMSCGSAWGRGWGRGVRRGLSEGGERGMRGGRGGG